MRMKFLAPVAALMIGLAAIPAKADVKVGTLSCDVAPGVGFIIGSQKKVSCTFYGTNGSVSEYVGTIGKLGVDVGFTSATRIMWAVVAPGTNVGNSLAGTYTGVNAEATLGVGVGANALIGGMHKSVNLQPVSIQGQAGLNVAAAVSSLTLKKVH